MPGNLFGPIVVVAIIRAAGFFVLGAAIAERRLVPLTEQVPCPVSPAK